MAQINKNACDELTKAIGFGSYNEFELKTAGGLVRRFLSMTDLVAETAVIEQLPVNYGHVEPGEAETWLDGFGIVRKRPGHVFFLDVRLCRRARPDEEFAAWAAGPSSRAMPEPITITEVTPEGKPVRRWTLLGAVATALKINQPMDGINFAIETLTLSMDQWRREELPPKEETQKEETRCRVVCDSQDKTQSAYAFRVLIPGFRSAGFSSVTGIGCDEQQGAGVYISRPVRNDNNDMMYWARTNEKLNIMIEGRDRDANVINRWWLRNARPVTYQLSDFNIDTASPLMETLGLTFDTFSRDLIGGEHLMGAADTSNGALLPDNKTRQKADGGEARPWGDKTPTGCYDDKTKKDAR